MPGERPVVVGCAWRTPCLEGSLATRPPEALASAVRVVGRLCSGDRVCGLASLCGGRDQRAGPWARLRVRRQVVLRGGLVLERVRRAVGRGRTAPGAPAGPSPSSAPPRMRPTRHRCGPFIAALWGAAAGLRTRWLRRPLVWACAGWMQLVRSGSTCCCRCREACPWLVGALLAPSGPCWRQPVCSGQTWWRLVGLGPTW